MCPIRLRVTSWHCDPIRFQASSASMFCKTSDFTDRRWPRTKGKSTCRYRDYYMKIWRQMRAATKISKYRIRRTDWWDVEHSAGKVKVRFSLSTPYRMSRGTAPYIIKLGIRRLASGPGRFTPGTHWIGGSGRFEEEEKISCPYWDSNPGPSSP